MIRHEFSPKSIEWVLQRKSDIAAQCIRDIALGLSSSTRGLDHYPSFTVELNDPMSRQLALLNTLPITIEELHRICSHSQVTAEGSPPVRNLLEFVLLTEKEDPNRPYSVLQLCNAMHLFHMQTADKQELRPVTITAQSTEAVEVHTLDSQTALRQQKVPEVYVGELPWIAVQEALSQLSQVGYYHSEALSGWQNEVLPEPMGLRPPRTEPAQKREKELTNNQRAVKLLLEIEPVFERLARLDRALYSNGNPLETITFYEAPPKIGYVMDELTQEELETIETRLRLQNHDFLEEVSGVLRVSISLDQNDTSVFDQLVKLDALYSRIKSYTQGGGNHIMKALSKGMDVRGRMIKFQYVQDIRYKWARILLTFDSYFYEGIFTI